MRAKESERHKDKRTDRQIVRKQRKGTQTDALRGKKRYKQRKEIKIKRGIFKTRARATGSKTQNNGKRNEGDTDSFFFFFFFLGGGGGGGRELCGCEYKHIVKKIERD